MSKFRISLHTVVSCVALSAAVAFAVGGVLSSGPTNTKASQLAVAERGVDATANRGSARTEEVTTTTVAPVATTVAPTTTSTTAVPVTTAKPVVTAPPAPAHSQTGGASYYAQPWAAKGCAHKTIAKGTVLTVTNVATGKSAKCVVNDRGPFIAGRIIDLDTTIFKQLASTSSGVFQARITW